MPANLGAAGCKWVSEDSFCVHIERDLFGQYRCKKYDIALEKHHRFDEPWRADVCGDDAVCEAWGRIMAARSLVPQK